MFRKYKKRKIDFIVLGAQKAGTTALHAHLKQHPDIGFAKVKEVHYFDNEEYFSKTPPDYRKYHDFFNYSAQKKVYGEVTPIYLYWRPCARRIWEYRSDIKLIAVLRNPVTRAMSHWNMEVAVERESETFLQAIKTEEERSKRALPLQDRFYSYVDRGFYAEQIRHYRRLFNDDQLLFIKYEDYRNHPEQTIREILHFLDLGSDDYEYAPREVHKRSYSREMTEEEHTLLLDKFRNDIREVERLLGWDCSDWLKPFSQD